MPEDAVLTDMRADWNRRAEEDANYYVAFGRKNQSLDEFFASGADQVRAFETELKRKPAAFWKGVSALEIGCGPGRLLRPLSRHFREIHGIDVSDEMLRRARQNLEGVPNIHLHPASGAALSGFPDDSFGFIYSYAVFQHIPSREVVMNYLAEAVRALAPGGLFVFQINALPDRGHVQSTWDGVRISAEEIIAFARRAGVLLLQLNDKETQYMWVTLQKVGQAFSLPLATPQLIRIRNAYTGEPVIPASGRFGAASIWMADLPEQADLLKLSAWVDGVEAYGCYVSAPINRLRHLNIILPKGTRTGMVPVDLYLNGAPVFRAQLARVIPPGPRFPHVCSLTDAVNLLSTHRVESGTARLVMEEVSEPQRLRIHVSGREAEPSYLCVNPLHERYQFDFPMPPGTSPGYNHVELLLGERRFAPIGIQVEASHAG
jgi:SAM-dependent methyltransferase